LLNSPPEWRLATASLRVRAKDPLAQFKTCNKLHHVLARAEAEGQNADEAVLLNSEGYVAEASSANIFWISAKRIYTPPADCGALPGITRGLILELSRELGLTAQERPCPPAALLGAEGVFLTLSSCGVAEAVSLDGSALGRSLLTQTVAAAYQKRLLR